VAENLQRIERRFSAPLRAPLSPEHMKLIGADGHAMEPPFLDLSVARRYRRRVTILLHPVASRRAWPEHGARPGAALRIDGHAARRRLWIDPGARALRRAVLASRRQHVGSD